VTEPMGPQSASSPHSASPVKPVPAARSVGAVKVYGRGDTEVRALDGIDVEFALGEFTAIMGASGSGKSTLLHCLAGLDGLTSGQTYIGAAELSQMSDRQLTLLRREKVGFIFQSLNLVPTLTALDNIVLPLTIAGRKADHRMVDEMVRMTGLAGRLRHRPGELSGGQQQRVAAARALLSHPEIVFADEPTGNLDSRSGGELLDFLRRAVDDLDQTIVMVTHDVFAASYADRVVFMADGRVASEMRSPTADSLLSAVRGLAGPRREAGAGAGTSQLRRADQRSRIQPSALRAPVGGV
jgi:putative ABC transport system ATP-binding protein